LVENREIFIPHRYFTGGEIAEFREDV